ncbi:serine/threonine-protein phosphatase 7 long form homolog [Quercus suber]|uniref:serine/threonine-protein phosphatase 7 long form homolog n=1 Tax=Quercus suber TaxID=58331 RepID=UPI0032DF2431
MGITFQDIEVMLGVLVDRLPVTGSVKLDWPALCLKLLGHRPPDLILHPYEDKSILAGARLRVTCLEARFRGPLAADATNEVVQQHARYHILAWLGTILFMDKSADRVSVMHLQFLNLISNTKRYS